jgi:hypothetical protein
MSAAICGIKMKEAPDIALLIRATLARNPGEIGFVRTKSQTKSRKNVQALRCNE